MSIPREIGSSNVLETALSLVHSAQHSVQVTMRAVEELGHPLPRDYFLLLEKKLAEGVVVSRIGFGTEEEFKRVGEHIHFQSPQYQFYRTSSPVYRRMLLVDDSKLLFAKTDESGRHVFYTEDPVLVSEYKDFFQKNRNPNVGGK